MVLTTKDTLVSDFVTYSPYWMTEKSRNVLGGTVMYAPRDGEPSKGDVNHTSGDDKECSLIGRRNEGRRKRRVSKLYARELGHAVFDLVFVDEGDLLRVEADHTGPDQVYP